MSIAGKECVMSNFAHNMIEFNMTFFCRSEEEVSKIVASCNKHKVGAGFHSGVVLLCKVIGLSF